MKVAIYFDVEPWMRDDSLLYLTTRPNDRKSSTAKRYKVEVELPDPAEPDEIIVSDAEVVSSSGGE